MPLSPVAASRHLTLLLLLSTLTASTAAAQEGGHSPEDAPIRALLVVLPLRSASQSALEEQLASTIESASVEPLLASSQDISFSAELLEELRQLEGEAEQAELALELEVAAERRRDVVELLEAAGATATDPILLAEALARQASTAAAAERDQEAIRLWRRALALRADLELDGTFSPSARRLFDRAREQGATLPPRPEAGALERLCDELGVAAVLWVAVGYDEGYEPGDLIVVRVLHQRGSSTPQEVRHGLGSGGDEREVVLPQPVLDGLRRELLEMARLRRSPAEGADGGPATAGDAGLDADHQQGDGGSRRPWYRQWWFYLTLGVVIAGAATATGLSLGLGERQVDVNVHLPSEPGDR